MVLTQKPSTPPVSDEELLRNAISIDAIEDDKPEAIEIGKPEKHTVRHVEASTPAYEVAVPETARVFVKTFVCKLKSDLSDPVHGEPKSIAILDFNINQYLSAHPELSVWHITTTVGVLTSKKGDEPAMFVNLWF